MWHHLTQHDKFSIPKAGKYCPEDPRRLRSKAGNALEGDEFEEFF